MGIITGRVCVLRILLCISAQLLICQRFPLCDGLGQDYSYTYVVNLGNLVSLHEEHNRLNRVTGSYSFLQPNGLIRTVQYKVDGNSGFQAAVQYRRHNMTGSYNFLQPNGLIGTVQYKVDGNSGFQAAVQYRRHNIKPKGHLKFPKDFHTPIWLTVPVSFIPRELLGPYHHLNGKRSP